MKQNLAGKHGDLPYDGYYGHGYNYPGHFPYAQGYGYGGYGMPFGHFGAPYGYTGHLPLNRERFGVNYREASADTIAMQKKKGVHNPVVPLDRPTPNHFGDTKPKPLNRSQMFVSAGEVAQEEATEEQRQRRRRRRRLGQIAYP